MNYIVFDLEWNQPYVPTPAIMQGTKYAMTNEIIQIGAVKLDYKLNEVDRFNGLVKPQILKSMHRSVQRLTGYTMERLTRDGKSFRSVYQSFLDWAGDDFAFITWGPDDMQILQENVIVSGTKERIQAPWYDGQELFNAFQGIGKDQVALGKAMEILGIEHDESLAHDGLVDALWTAEICRRIPFVQIVRELEGKGQKKEVFLYPLHRISFSIHGGYFSIPSVPHDQFLRSMRCPQCGRHMHHESIESVSKHRYISIGRCGTHGIFGCHWYVGKEDQKGLRFFVGKSITDAPDELIHFYKSKKEINRIKQERMKEAQRRYYEQYRQER